MRDFYLYLRRKPYIREISEYIDSNTSVITSNCFSGRIMQDLKVRYNSPTLGMWIMPSDFATFCADLKKYLAADIQIVNHSKNDLGNFKMTHAKHPYPVGVLENNVEIHFLHYESAAEAISKWKRRAERVNYDDYILIGFEQNGCTEADVKEFDSIDYAKKLFFTSKPYKYSSVVYIPEFASLGYAGDPYKKSYVYYKYLSQWMKNHLDKKKV